MSFILLKVLLVLHAAQTGAEQTADCHEDVSLPCPGASTTPFISVTWYKFHKGSKEGVITKHRGHAEPRVYSPSRQAVFGQDYSLTLLSVTPEDSGTYECAINADIGGRNQNSRVALVVNVCATEASTVMTTNLLQSVEPQQEALEELPLLWGLLGCGALSLLKALLSLLTVLVIRAVRRSRRRSGGTKLKRTYLE